MEYKRINKYEIEIMPGAQPINVVLETMAKLFYGKAVPVGLGYLQPFGMPVDVINFSQFMHKDKLYMDYVYGRQCKTSIRIKDGRLILDAFLFEGSRGAVEPLLEAVKDELEKLIG